MTFIRCLNRVSSLTQQHQTLYFGARRGPKNLGWYQKAIKQKDRITDIAPVRNFPEETLHGKERMKAFMDIRMGEGNSPRRVTLRLAVSALVVSWFCADFRRYTSRIFWYEQDDIVPKTVENFVNVSRNYGYVCICGNKA